MSIEVRHIFKTFGRFQALSDVSLIVPSGKLVALLGPSGSGKTTLLRIIGGLEPPQPNPDSRVLFDGIDVADRQIGRRQVGFVFQHYALFKHLTVFENVAFGLRARPRKTRPSEAKIRAKVMELLDLIQLGNLEKRYPWQLSGGQRQRVALARALAVEPKVLLLDEPFGALDAKVRQELRAWLRQLHQTVHVTTLFVTHDQEEALEVADGIVVMNRGRIEQQGTPDEVFHQPASPFVMDFLGQVNLFHGRSEDTPDQPPKLFVRPHELEILDRIDNGVMAATVVRVQSAGPSVKVELRSASSAGPILAEISHLDQQRLGLIAGRDVFVRPRRSRVFSEDYSI